MTLIIGCITPVYGIIAGDTQLTVGDLNRGRNLKQEVEIKVKKCSNNFMFGILGKWSWFDVSEDGKATYINEYDNLQKGILNYKVTDKLDFLKKYLIGRPKIEATSIYINQTKGVFELDTVVSNNDITDLKRLVAVDRQLLFNEPFFHTSNDFVENLISELTEQYKIDNSLEANLFLLNNTILNIISRGKQLSISNGKETFLDINNTVGGYVTIQVISKTGVHCLYNSYKSDYNTLLDKTTYIFSNYLNNHKVIRYIDNLAMLVKNINNDFNEDFLSKALIKVCEMQTSFIIDNNILDIAKMNILLNFINVKYHLELSLFKENVENNESDSSLSNLFFDDFFENEIDINYLKGFF